ncbi:uncharacterized protein LOC132725679 [Ruditapes philippinarum]|uniref:uncharacterized protein LOC132725679 n=1 Tax=Ruditapes philippinarum TaxID=129788 RepID=UPI00295AB8AF|nr:uncharacterized protein LOC132725679 [Ruditapes philippinarum]
MDSNQQKGSDVARMIWIVGSPIIFAVGVFVHGHVLIGIKLSDVVIVETSTARKKIIPHNLTVWLTNTSCESILHQIPDIEIDYIDDLMLETLCNISFNPDIDNLATIQESTKDRKIKVCWYDDINYGQYFSGIHQIMATVSYIIIPATIFFAGFIIIIKSLHESKNWRKRMGTEFMRTKRASDNHATQITVTLLFVNIVFIITTTPALIYLMGRSTWVDENLGMTEEQEIIWAIVNLMVYINHSINFILYFLSGQRFRRTVEWVTEARSVLVISDDSHDICTDTINDEAGELRFDSQKLSSYSFGNKCSVTVQPQSDFLPQPILVLFYFTKFGLSETCEYLNVTVQEGLILRKPVQGLPRHLCGHNTSLEDPSQIFTTEASIFTVTFQRQKIASYPRWNFTIKYIAFSLGKCDKAGVYKCTNGHCIANDYMCSNDVNACGDNGEHMQSCAIHDAVIDTLKIIGEFSWIILVIIGLCVLKGCWKRCREKYRSSRSSCRCNLFEHLSNCRISIRRRLNTFQRSRSSFRARSIRDSFELRNAQRVRSLHARENGRESSNEDPASDEQIRDPTSPEIPPPSYDEVVASSDTTTSVPSYEEVMQNKNKYEINV